MENNNHLLDILTLINNLQKNVINNDTNNSCSRPILGDNTTLIYNTRPVTFYLCNNSPLTVNYSTGESSIFRIENIEGNCITVRILESDDEGNITPTNEFATVNISCIAAIRCLSDIRRFNNRNYGTQVDSYVFVIYSKLKTRIARKVVVDAVQKKPFVFIIDEINRGEISKIFGELFFSIDPGYRGEKGRVNTQYQNMIEEGDVFVKGFYVPENVYIIGTMNDIDRSVESMDFAMRRRFTWKEVTPADTEYMLDTLDCATEAKATMNRLNKAIEETEGLGAAYLIGPAYFLKLGENGGDFDKLWKMNIEPLLKEYLRGFRKTKDILDKFSKAYFNKIDED